MFKVGDRVQVAAENFGEGDYIAGQIGVVEGIVDGKESCGPGGIGASVRFPHGIFYLFGSEMTVPDVATAPDVAVSNEPDMDDLVRYAARAARDNPDLTIMVDPATMTLLFQAKE